MSECDGNQELLDTDESDESSSDDSSSDESEDDLANITFAEIEQAIEDINIWMKVHANTPIDAGRFEFTGNPGVTVDVDDEWRELDYLKLFLDQNIIDIIVNETNRFAEQYLEKKYPRQSAREKYGWAPVDSDEMWVFFAILIYQAMVIKPKQRWYWSKNKIVETPFVNNLMTLKRFERIMKFLHFSNNEAYDPLTHPNPKLRKIYEIFTAINDKFEALYKPERDISIDESLMGFKGRLSWKQYIPSKRARFGLKFYMMCESESGYILKTILYTGKETEKDDTYKEYGVTGAIVMALSEKLLKKGHCLIMDNFYNSPDLFDLLLNNKTDAYGTLRSNRKGLPSDFSKTKLRKGESACWVKEGMMVMKWCDKKEISLISTCHDVSFKEVQPKFGPSKLKPAVVSDYNLKMGGVDKADQQMASYTIMRNQQKKCYKKLFRHLLDQCLFNAYVLHKKYREKRQEHLSFYMQVMIQIVQTHQKDGARVSNRGRQRIGNAVVDETTPMRLIERHFPAFIPPTHNKENPTRKCMVCCHEKDGNKKFRKETRYYCRHCDIALCAAPCFEIYHTREDI